MPAPIPTLDGQVSGCDWWEIAEFQDTAPSSVDDICEDRSSGDVMSKFNEEICTSKSVPPCEGNMLSTASTSEDGTPRVHEDPHPDPFGVFETADEAESSALWEERVRAAFKAKEEAEAAGLRAREEAEAAERARLAEEETEVARLRRAREEAEAVERARLAEEMAEVTRMREAADKAMREARWEKAQAREAWRAAVAEADHAAELKQRAASEVRLETAPGASCTAGPERASESQHEPALKVPNPVRQRFIPFFGSTLVVECGSVVPEGSQSP